MQTMTMLMFVVLIIAILGLGFTGWTLSLRYGNRELRHLEHMAAIEKGVPLAAVQREPFPPTRMYLLRGLQWMGVGISMALFILAVSLGTRVVVEEKLVSALVPAEAEHANQSGGPAATPSRPSSEPTDQEPKYAYVIPPGFSVLGLIPVSIGIAYFVFFRLESDNRA